MTQPRSPSAGMAFIAALLIGGIVATVVGAVLTMGISFLFELVDPTRGLRYGTGALTSLIIGAIVGGATVISRPAGPVVPVLAAVLTFFAGLVGDLLGIMIYAVFQVAPSLKMAEIYLKSYAHITPVGLLILILGPAVAFGLSALKHLRRRTQTPNAGAWGAPYGGQVQPPPPGFQQPGFQQPHGQPGAPSPYGQPGAQQAPSNILPNPPLNVPPSAPPSASPDVPPPGAPPEAPPPAFPPPA